MAEPLGLVAYNIEANSRGAKRNDVLLNVIERFNARNI